MEKQPLTAPLTEVSSDSGTGVQYAKNKASYMANVSGYMANVSQRRKGIMVFVGLAIVAAILLSVGAGHNWWHSCGWTSRCGPGHCSQIDLECPSCNGGYCNQTYTEGPSCRSGHCYQVGAVNPDCFGGHCDQQFAHNPSCDRGYCNQMNATGRVQCAGHNCQQ
eukprot:m.50180 g.50180  ORF g.50180 m.50180 type:complete len:164 (+) comp21227_c1_seq1:281-772(+)